MAAATCPFCKAYVNFRTESVSEVPKGLGGPIPGFAYRVLKCANELCLMSSTAITDGDTKIVKMWPQEVGGKEFPDVPDQIASAANEAHLCLSVSAHRGAVAMARAVVEATAKDHQIVTGTLMAKITKMAENGVISPAMKDAADEVRFAGNEVAHGDLVEAPLAAEDAQEVVDLMDAILLRVYQEPKQVARVRERRKARGGATA